MDFGDKLRRLMQEKQISVTELAEASGVNRNTLYSYLRRNTKKPDPAVLEKIAPVLGASAPTLLGMKAEPSAQLRLRKGSTASYRSQRSRPREDNAVNLPDGAEDLWGIRETLRRRPEMAQAFLKGKKFTRHQKKVVDAVFERIKEEDEKRASCQTPED